MVQRFEPVEKEGWRLFTTQSPEFSSATVDELTKCALRVAGGEAGALLRRSRHGTTFRIRLKIEPGGDLDAFIKVIDAPRGLGALKRWIRGSKAAHIARVTDDLNLAGFTAPPILIYGSEGHGGREMVVARRAKGEGPLRILALLAGSPAHKWAMLRALGGTIARLHRAGFVHGDLTPFNIFVLRSEPPRFTFFDHERTRRTFVLGRHRRQLRNLVQLGRFAMPGVSRTDRMRVLYGYAGERNPRGRRALIRTVARLLERRIRSGGFEPVKPL